MSEERESLIDVFERNGVTTKEFEDLKRGTYIAFSVDSNNAQITKPFVDALRNRDFDKIHHIEIRDEFIILSVSKRDQSPMGCERFFHELRKLFENIVGGEVDPNLVKYRYVDLEKSKTEFIELEGKEKIERAQKGKKGAVAIKGDIGAVKEKKESKLKKSIFDAIDFFFEIVGIKEKDDLSK